VFMTGGEVEDEVAEAEQSHEVVEGRLENQAHLELLTAIREMSRAEAALNDADTNRALGFERAALKALQRAFDRRRYLLRTLSERARLDPARRLTGDRDRASGWERRVSRTDEPDRLRMLRGLMLELADTPTADEAARLPELAARLSGIDSSDLELQAAANELASATSGARRSEARVQAMRMVTSRALALMPNGAAVDLPGDSLAGYFADARRGTTRSKGRR
jgi:hypothetical protein